MSIIYQSERLKFLTLDTQDAELVLKLFNQPDCLRYIGDRGLRTVEDARNYIHNSPRASYAEHGYGMYLLVRKQDGVALGLCGLVKRDYLHVPDIGFALLREYEGQGYALEAARATMGYARHTLELSVLAAITDPDNDKSIGLLKKLGMQFKCHMSVPGEEGKQVNYFEVDYSDT